MPQPIMAAMLSCQGLELTDNEKNLLSQANPLGINLFARNISGKEQLRKLIHSIRETIGRNDILIAVDQEGGRVRRLAEPEWRGYTHPITIGALPPKEAQRATELQAILISADLKEIGINWNYAPSLDLIYPQTSPVLKSRCFSSSELVVGQLGKTMVDTYINNSICPCIKHMPGHGRAAVDPHLHLPVLPYSLEELANDFYPFQQTNDAPAGMTAHIIIPEIDDQRPVTQSPKAIEKLIRRIIGFDGLLISDAIDMHALKGSVGEKANLSLEAGCDCVCYALGDINELHELTDTCPPLTDMAMERYSKIKTIITKPSDLPNTDKLAKEYDQLIGKVEPYVDTYDATEVLNKLKNKGE